MNTLQKKIMHRVYTIFALRVVQHPVTIQIGLFLLALFVFTKLVFVQRIVEGLLSTPLGEVPAYALRIVLHDIQRGEILTLLTVGVMVFVALSLPRRVYRLFVPKLPAARVPQRG